MGTPILFFFFDKYICLHLEEERRELNAVVMEVVAHTLKAFLFWHHHQASHLTALEPISS